MALVASAVTALLSLVLAWRLGKRYGQRRSLHSLFYALGLAFAAVAAGADFVARAMGQWHPLAFRLYWFSAAGLVGLLGMGSAALLGRPAAEGRGGAAVRWIANAALAILAVLVLWLAGAAATFPVDPAVLGQVGEIATRAPEGVKAPFVLTSSVGATVIFLGALWSWWLTRRHPVLLIALGTVFFSAGGLAGRFGGVAAFYAAQALGSILLYLGVEGSFSRPAGRGPGVGG
ncbi:MAG: hypothetical protein L6E13_06560 [Firmicutes bacterium]|nr:hypothetical protein [Bacillota bacterium]